MKTYTFVPKQKYAKAYGNNLRISTKGSEKICRVLRRKKLSSAKRLLDDLLSEKRSLDGKYYTKTVKNIKMLLESCEKNAEFLGLSSDALFVHASAHTGTIMRRRRRRSGFGTKIKSTNIEIMLIEKGKTKGVSKEKIEKEIKKKIEEKAEKIAEKHKAEIKKEVNGLHETEKKIKEDEKNLEKVEKKAEEKGD